MAGPLRHLEGYAGILQADAYAGYNALFRGDRLPAPMLRALCWAHARRKFFELADIAGQARATAFTRNGIDYLRETRGYPSSCYYRPNLRP